MPSNDKFSVDVTNTLAWTLSISATIAQGLMSLGGILAIWPSSIVWGLWAFTLTMAYEGEVNTENCKGAFDKLSDPLYVKTIVMQQYLRKKFASFDHHRARFSNRPLNEDEKKEVLLRHEFVFFKNGDEIDLAYCDQSGAYREIKLSKQAALFLKDYGQSLTDDEWILDKDVQKLNRLLSRFPEADKPIALINQSQNTYPSYVKQYLIQLRKVYQLKSTIHDLCPDEEAQKTVDAMEKHLREFEALMLEGLLDSNDLPDKAGLEDSYWSYCHPVESPDGFYLEKKNQLLIWLKEDRALWQAHLAWHQYYLYLAGVFSALSGLIMAIANSYLYYQMFTQIPFLMTIPLAFLPWIILPLVIISGVAQFLLLFNTLADMLALNPFEKFFERVNQAHWNTMTRSLIWGFIALFALACSVTFCTAGTWVTVFGQAMPIFIWISFIPSLFFNFIFPLCISLAELLFSIQNISNTLDNLQNNPWVISLLQMQWTLPLNLMIWADFFSRLGMGLLGISLAEFEQESFLQRINPFRLILGVLYQPSRILLFLAHLFCEGEMSDRIANVPIFLSVSLAVVLNLFQDLDYFFGHSHVDVTDTEALLSNRFYNPSHDHHDNLPEHILKCLLYPLILASYAWAYWAQPEKTEDLKKQARHMALSAVPDFRKTENHAFFLFTAAKTSEPLPLKSACCASFSCGPG